MMAKKMKQSRKSYTREFKLSVVTFYKGKNPYRTSKHFFDEYQTKTVLRWVRNEESIQKAKKGSKHTDHKRPPLYQNMEAELYREYKELHK